MSDLTGLGLGGKPRTSAGVRPRNIDAPGAYSSATRASASEPREETFTAPIVQRREPFFFMTVLYSVFFAFLSVTFPLYFYFVPNFSNSDVRPALLVAYLILWPIGVILPVILLWWRDITEWNSAMSSFYLVAVLGWPVVTLLIKIRSLFVLGDAGIGYWGHYPVFILLEILWPLFALAFWVIKRRSINEKVLIQREIRREYKEQLRNRLGSSS